MYRPLAMMAMLTAPNTAVETQLVAVGPKGLTALPEARPGGQCRAVVLIHGFRAYPFSRYGVV